MFFFAPCLSFHFNFGVAKYRHFSECAFASIELKCHKELMHTYFSAPAIYSPVLVSFARIGSNFFPLFSPSCGFAYRSTFFAPSNTYNVEKNRKQDLTTYIQTLC